jgi:integrase
MVYLWSSARNLDLDQLLICGEFPSMDQMEDLALFLRMDRKSQDLECAAPTARKSTKIVRLEQVRGGFNDHQPNHSQISAVEGGARIRVAANYFEFHLRRRLAAMRAPATEIELVKSTSEAAIARLRALIPLAGIASEDETLEGLTKATMVTAEHAFHPDSDENPFSTPFLRARNYLIFKFLVETGSRRSELRYIKVEDVDYSTHRVRLRVSKTIARTNPISAQLSIAFHDFIINHWSKLPPRARSHGYLFVTADGNHLALDSINLVFREVRRKVPGLPAELAPHAFRRTWNDRLSEKVDAQPADKRMPPEQEIQVRNRLMGWKKGSMMGERYAKRFIRKRADEIGEELANDLTQGKPADD